MACEIKCNALVLVSLESGYCNDGNAVSFPKSLEATQ